MDNQKYDPVTMTYDMTEGRTDLSHSYRYFDYSYAYDRGIADSGARPDITFNSVVYCAEETTTATYEFTPTSNGYYLCVAIAMNTDNTATTSITTTGTTHGYVANYKPAGVGYNSFSIMCCYLTTSQTATLNASASNYRSSTYVVIKLNNAISTITSAGIHQVGTTSASTEATVKLENAAIGDNYIAIASQYIGKTGNVVIKSRAICASGCVIEAIDANSYVSTYNRAQAVIATASVRNTDQPIAFNGNTLQTTTNGNLVLAVFKVT